MFDTDLLISFSFMALLFLRQIMILKQDNKIDYAPLILAIGAISSIIHFIIHQENHNLILLLRESSFPVLVALILFIIMNISHQNQKSENSRIKDVSEMMLFSKIGDLEDFILELEKRMMVAQTERIGINEEINIKSKEDIKALDILQANQLNISDKFDLMQEWHKNILKKIDNFTEVHMPELNNIVHKHIDILRVSEQDHYKHIKLILDKVAEDGYDIDEIKLELNNIKTLSNDISTSITSQTMGKLSGITTTLEEQVKSLESHTQSVKISLNEDENILASIRQQSEIIMKQMILSSNKMKELEKQNSEFYDMFAPLEELVNEIKNIKSDYVKSKLQLSSMSNEFKIKEKEHIDIIKEQINTLSEDIYKKIDDSLEKLHEHYHIADEDITKSVQILAKQAQLKKGAYS